eukprot:TRINITY_DN7153_c0_g2_i1.p1 TRINITY_DN7153_c0_g2~~TRINITY_DN7153_c0_g2_i1.p1  ORF type:complete len:578 (-),score=102.43 TRINITY_DN7153_c0_g2_i1:636-2276(-)
MASRDVRFDKDPPIPDTYDYLERMNGGAPDMPWKIELPPGYGGSQSCQPGCPREADLLGVPDSNSPAGHSEDDGGAADANPFPNQLQPPWAMTPMAPMGPMMPMPMASHECAVIAQHWMGLAHQAHYLEQAAGNELGMPGMPGMPGMWPASYGGYGSMPPGVHPGQYSKGKQGGKARGGKGAAKHGGKGAVKPPVQQQVASSGQSTSANQNNAAPSRPAGPKAFTWSAPVQEMHKNGRTYIDGVIFHLALDRKFLRPGIGTDSSMKHLNLDKITMQGGGEMTYEEYTHARESSKKTQSKSAPEGNLSKEEQQSTVKVHGSEDQVVELFFEELTLLRCKLRMKDGVEIMTFPEFLALTEDERKARLPIQVQVTQCGEQELRTTVMIRNLPNNYERDDVKKLLDDKGNSQDAANEVHHSWAAEVWEALDGFKDWRIIQEKKSSKECEVTWGSSEHQGKQHHIERYRNSPVMHADNQPQYKPAIFDDDGKIVPFPPPAEGKSLRKPRTKKQPRTGCKSPGGSEAEDDGKDADAGSVVGGSGGGTGHEQT